MKLAASLVILVGLLSAGVALSSPSPPERAGRSVCPSVLESVFVDISAAMRLPWRGLFGSSNWSLSKTTSTDCYYSKPNEYTATAYPPSGMSASQCIVRNNAFRCIATILECPLEVRGVIKYISGPIPDGYRKSPSVGPVKLFFDMASNSGVTDGTGVPLLSCRYHGVVDGPLLTKTN